jgi:Fe(3+) dicitrate transport protein
MQAINIKDTINVSTRHYNNRVVDIDKYRNYGAELRYLTNYNIGKLTQTLTASAKYFHGKTDRFKNGKGTTGVDDDYSIVDPTFPQDLNFATNNFAAAVENVFRVTKDFIIIPAARFESVSTIANGRLSYTGTTPNIIRDQQRSRNFLLFGVGTEYHVGNTELYANFTQSFRPMQFADLAVASTTDSVDANLEDAHSYNIDLGYRGKLRNYLTFDVGVFYLNYNNRIGNISGVVPGRNFKTNVGNSISKGFEGLIEYNLMQSGVIKNVTGEVSVFGSYAYTHARYDEFTAGTAKLNDKKVENAPEHIFRGGLTFFYKGLSLTGQVSYVSETFSDANNTVTPNAAATTGLIPSYTITDVAATYRVNNFTFKAGVNNVTNEKYFTRRAGGYPGPGLMPSDARGWYVSLGVKL